MPRVHILLLWVLSFCAVGSLVNAQTAESAATSYDSYRAQIEHKLLDLDYAAAAKLCRFYHQDGDIPRFYNNHALFLQAFIWQDQQSADAYWADADLQIAFFTQHKVEDPLNRPFLAEIILKKAMVQVLMGQQMKAAYNLQKAWSILQKQLKKYPNHPQNDRLLGVFHLAFSGVPSEYKWVLKIFGMQGEFDTGLALLERAAAEAPFMRLETQLVLYYVERNLQADTREATLRMDSLHAQFPQLTVLNYLKAHSLLDIGAHTEAKQLLTPLLSKAAVLPYLHYQMGKACYYTEDFEAARKHFYDYAITYRGKLFVADALFKRAMAHALSGNRVKARASFHELANSYAHRVSQFDEDKYAFTQASRLQRDLLTPAQQELAYLRYLSDANRLQQGAARAQQLLAKSRTLDNDARTELYYRLGRLYQNLGRWDEAKTAFRSAIIQNPTEALWMKVYAHYYIGQMLEQQAEWHDARRYYKESLQFSGYDYQKSLEQKSKAALSRLRNKRYEIED